MPERSEFGRSRIAPTSLRPLAHPRSLAFGATLAIFLVCLASCKRDEPRTGSNVDQPAAATPTSEVEAFWALLDRTSKDPSLVAGSDEFRQFVVAAKVRSSIVRRFSRCTEDRQSRLMAHLRKLAENGLTYSEFLPIVDEALDDPHPFSINALHCALYYEIPDRKSRLLPILRGDGYGVPTALDIYLTLYGTDQMDADLDRCLKLPGNYWPLARMAAVIVKHCDGSFRDRGLEAIDRVIENLPEDELPIVAGMMCRRLAEGSRPGSDALLKVAREISSSAEEEFAAHARRYLQKFDDPSKREP